MVAAICIAMDKCFPALPWAFSHDCSMHYYNIHIILHCTTAIIYNIILYTVFILCACIFQLTANKVF